MILIPFFYQGREYYIDRYISSVADYCHAYGVTREEAIKILKIEPYYDLDFEVEEYRYYVETLKDREDLTEEQNKRYMIAKLHNIIDDVKDNKAGDRIKAMELLLKLHASLRDNKASFEETLNGKTDEELEELYKRFSPPGIG